MSFLLIGAVCLCVSWDCSGVCIEGMSALSEYISHSSMPHRDAQLWRTPWLQGTAGHVHFELMFQGMDGDQSRTISWEEFKGAMESAKPGQVLFEE